MAQSLVKLTLESNQYEANLRQAKKSWEDFTKGLGMSASKFSGVAAALGAVSGALKVVKDAFKVNEEAMDEWGRSTEAATALYDGFLRSLNNGDISGFLSRIDQITEAARDAYDALDELGTFNAFNQINTQRTRTQYTEDYAGYRTGKVSKEQVQKSAKAYQDELRERQKLEQDAYEKAIGEYAAKMGVARGTLGQILEEYSYEQFNELKATPLTGKKTLPYSPTSYSSASYEVDTPANDTERMAEALRKLTDEELQSLQAMGAQAQRTGEEIAQVDKQLARVLNSKTTGSGSGKSNKKELTEQQINQQKINRLELEYVKLGDVSTEAARKRQEEIQKEITLLEKRNGLISYRTEQAHGRYNLKASDVDLSDMRVNGSLFGKPNDRNGRTASGDLKLMLDEKAMKALNRELEKNMKKEDKSFAEGFSQLSGGLNSIFGGIQQLGVEIPDGIRQGLNVLTGISTILSGIATTILAIQVIQGADLIMPFANGGVVHAANGFTVPGNYMSSDKVPILANSGELILNRAAQGNLVAQMSGMGNGLYLTTEISAEKLRIVLNNNSRRRGRGEYVTTNRMKG